MWSRIDLTPLYSVNDTSCVQTILLYEKYKQSLKYIISNKPIRNLNIKHYYLKSVVLSITPILLSYKTVEIVQIFNNFFSRVWYEIILWYGMTL